MMPGMFMRYWGIQPAEGLCPQCFLPAVMVIQFDLASHPHAPPPQPDQLLRQHVCEDCCDSVGEPL